MRGWGLAGAIVLLCLCAVKMYQVSDSSMPCVLCEMNEKGSREEDKKRRREEGKEGHYCCSVNPKP